MKRVIILVLVLGMFMTAVVPGPARASGFHVKSIGEMETGGRQISKWWYTGLRPTIRGEAMPGSDIIVDIDGVRTQISADSAGEWFYTPAEALSEGEHTISITGDGTAINFTLVLGTNNVDYDKVGLGGGETLPTVGFLLPTLLLGGGGLGLVLTGKKLLK